MLSDLVSIDRLCGQVNVGGVLDIEYAPIDWVDLATWDPIINSMRNFQHEVNFLGGKTWLKLPLQTTKESWREQQRTTTQGPYTLQRLTGSIPKGKPELTDQIDRMSRLYFIIRILDRNGQYWLIGSPYFPLSFSGSLSTGNEAPQLNGYTIEFSGETPYRAYGFAPVFG